jgi:hypothetical protein
MIIFRGFLKIVKVILHPLLLSVVRLNVRIGGLQCTLCEHFEQFAHSVIFQLVVTDEVLVLVTLSVASSTAWPTLLLWDVLSHSREHVSPMSGVPLVVQVLNEYERTFFGRATVES